MANTLTARTESNRANSQDLRILANFLAPSRSVSVNLTKVLLNTLTSSRSTAPITFGGLITHIAMRFGFPHLPSASRDQSTLNFRHLANSNYIDPISSEWKIPTSAGVIRRIPMPFVFLPPLHPNAPNYLFPRPEDPAEPPLPPSSSPPRPPVVDRYHRRRRPRVEPDAPHSPGPMPDRPTASPSHGHQSGDPMFAAIQGLQRSMEQLRAGQQRIQDDQERALLPIYDYFYRQGHIGTDYQHPSWYVPPTRGPSGAFLDPGAGPSNVAPPGNQSGESDIDLSDSE